MILKRIAFTIALALLVASSLRSQSKPDVVFGEYREAPADTAWYVPYRLVNQQQYQKAYEEFKSIQTRYQEQSNFKDYLFVANQYSYWIYTHRQRDKAKEILLNAVDMAKEHLGAKHIEMLIGYYNLAILEPNVTDKIPWYEAFLNNYSKDDYPRFGFIINRDIGSRYYSLGQYKKAWEHWDACINDFDMPTSSISDLYAAIGGNIAAHDIEMAIEYLTKSIELLDKSKDDVGMEIILSDNIGRFYLQNADYNNAIKFCARANELLKSNRDLSDYKMLNRHNRYTTIIESYIRLGDFESAEIYLKELREELPGFANPKVSEGLAVFYESMLYRMSSQYDMASKKLDEFYKIYIDIYKSPLSPTLVNYYLDKADIYHKTNSYTKAIAYYENTLKTIGFNHYQSIDDNFKLLPPESFHNLYIPYVRDILLSMLETYRLKLSEEANEDELQHMLKLVSYTNLIIKYHYSGIADERLAMEASTNLKKTSYYGMYAAWKLSEGNKTYIDTAFVLSDNPRAFNLNFQRNIAKSYSSDSAQQVLKRITELTNQIANIELGDENDHLFELRKQLYRAKVDLSDKYSTNLVFMDNTANALAVKPLLKESAAAIQYLAKGDTLFIIGKNQGMSMFELVVEENILQKLRGFSRDIRTGGSSSQYQQELYNLLIKPVEAVVLGNNKLHIFPDESLMEVPFEMLTNTKGEMLIKNYSIEYLYSTKGFSSSEKLERFNLLAVAPSFEEVEIIPQTMLSQANTYDKEIFRTSNNRTMLVALPHSQSEVEEISRLFDSNKMSVKQIVGSEATKERFMEQVPNHNIIHIASHGVSGDRFNSGLFFYSSGSDKLSNHFLRMPELFNLETNANLVVLSACKTGIGEILEGEGVMALPRGFIYAGAQNVIASLWKVHDQKTKELMILFYRFILQGHSYSDALRLVKLECISQGYLPLDWAGFILIKG